MSLENLFFHFEVFLSCIEFSLTLLQGKSVHRTRTEKKTTLKRLGFTSAYATQTRQKS